MIILFGAGEEGKKQLRFLKYIGMNKYVEAFCDNYTDETEIDGIKVYTYNECKTKNRPFVITVLSSKAKKEIEGQLTSDDAIYFDNVSDWIISEKYEWDRVSLNREFCAFYHNECMDEYFDTVERKSSIDRFWGENTIFYQMFKHLDTTNIVELACGRGRHVPRYIDVAKKITLVDVLKKNIDYCKERFRNETKIEYYVNNGYDLSDLPNNSYTALFTYDAMVHFEMMDVYSYLRETHRILLPGSYALCHHSNDDKNYKNSFEQTTNPGRRSFMSKDIFAYLAYRAGFDVIEQKVFDWSAPQMDCLSLIYKS